MAAMVSLQSSMSSLSLSSNHPFFGRQISTPSVSSLPFNSPWKPCQIVAKVKRWEQNKNRKPNGRPILQKMHVRIGDTVKIISGREKGEVGEITKLNKRDSTVIVDGLNLKTKHQKGQGDEPGQIIQVEGAIHSSNVMLYSIEKEVASRVGHTTLENGKRVRYLIKTGEVLDGAERWKELKEAKRLEAESNK